MRVLMTGGGGAGNEALFRLFEARYETHFADADERAIDDAISAARRHRIPLAGDPVFVAGVSSLCRELAIDVLVPGVDEELPHMAAVAGEMPGLRILVPASEYIATMNDKLASMQLLRSRGIDVPRTTTAAEPSLGFPCLAKPRQGRGSRGVQVLNASADLAAYIQLSGLAANQIVLQELLGGQEYTVLMAADAATRLHAVVPVRVAIKRGITLRAATADQPDIVAACRAIHAAVPASGCYNIQLMQTPNGRILPFEINPRVSTTFCLGVAAGVDPIAIFVGARAPSDLLPFRSDLELRRFWRNSFAAQR